MWSASLKFASEDRRKSGHTYSHPDLVIAVTAHHHGFIVVTRDRSDCRNFAVGRLGALALAY